jgi:murein tripeptide amidase MpaA
VKLSSNFESGSLGEYKIIDSTWTKISGSDSILTLSYDVYSRLDPLNPVDTAVPPSARWYFFKMEGVKGKQVFLNIHNSEAIRPFYSYDGVNFFRFDESENYAKNKLHKIFKEDTVYISHFIPYTYSRLLNKTEEWKKSEFVKEQEIGKSQLGVPMLMLTITDSRFDDSNKKRVWIHGRAHPSEQPCSWHLEAMIDLLTSGSEYANSLLSQTVFYIVPFINPDGVIGGYSRSSSTGVNLEINWDAADSLTTPEVKALKNKISELTSERPFDLFLNMHSQIANSVTYWIHTLESTSAVTYKNQLLLTNLTINNNPYFSSKDQSFSGVAPRYAEGWLWNQFGDRTVAITFETPYTFYNNKRDGEWVSISNLSKMAGNSLFAISDYLNISTPDRILVAPKILAKRRWEKDVDLGSLYFGNEYYKADSKRAKFVLKVPFLNKGSYRVFSWRVGPVDKISPEGTNLWKEVGCVVQKRDGSFRWRAKANQFDGVADMILLVK